MSEPNSGAAAPAQPSSPEQSADAVMDSIDGANGANSGNVDVSEPVDVEDASDSELQDVIDDENASEEEVEEAKEELAKRLSLKINGKEEEFDLSNDDHIERLKQYAQKGEGADQKFQEAAKMRKQMEEFAKLMQDDPIEALRKLGKDPDSIAEDYMKQRIADLSKSPEQKEREKLQKELEEIRKEKERLENEKHEAEQHRIQEEYSRQLDVEITEALDKSELPKSPYVVKRIAENLMLGIEKNPDISVADILPIVERQIKGEIRQMFEALPEEIVEKILGDNVSNKLRKRRLSRMKKPVETASQVKPTGQAEIKKAQAEAANEDKPKAAKDFFSKIGSF